MLKVTDKLYVSPQLDAQDILDAKAAGFAAIINNRPNGEEPGQPTAKANGRAAETVGLAYSYIPVVPGLIDEAQVRAFQRAFADAPGPVLAHCRTGTRSATLYAIGEVLDGRMSRQDIAQLGERLGLDLSGALRWLESNPTSDVR